VFFAESPIDFETLLPIALFGMVAAGAWFVLDRLAAGKPRAVERLDELKNPRVRRSAADAPIKKQSAMSKVLENAAPALARPLTPKNDHEMSKLKVKLANAGFRGEGASRVFLGIKFVSLIAALLIGGGTVFAVRGIDRNSLVLTVFTAGIGLYLPELIVGFIGRSRKQAIFHALPDALDLMVVCVEAGLGLDQAMRKVSDEMFKSYPVLAAEFALSNFQLQMGRPRNEVLHELGVRTGVGDLRTLAGVLIQADKFGSSVAHALRVQSDSMRTRRRQLAEEKAAKTAVKLIFPLVLFIFPGIFVVLVGPAAVTMVREMFPKMSGN
jgi:tight adherence protein C